MDEHRWHDIKTYLLEFETIQNDQMCKRVQVRNGYMRDSKGI